MRLRFFVLNLVFVAFAVLLGRAWLHARPAEQPETVMVTLRAKPGSEAALADVIARHYETARKLDLLRDLTAGTPHVTVRASDAADKTYFVEIFTWRDSAIPDSAPAAIQAIWREMNNLVEARGGRPGLEFAEVAVLSR